MKKWKDIVESSPAIDDICPVCIRAVEMSDDEDYVLDTDVKPWQLYHGTCYRMAHPRQRRTKGKFV